MNILEAYQVLELNETATDDEIKKAFRKKAAQYHPDQNKEVGAEDKFKHINEAYQILTGKQNHDQIGTNVHGGHQTINLQDIMEQFRIHFGPQQSTRFDHFSSTHRSKIDLSPLQCNLSIDFETSILGATKELKYTVRNYCDKCKGNGVDNNKSTVCPQCKGAKYIVNRVVGSNFSRTEHFMCANCNGSGTVGEACVNCNGNGFNLKENKINITIPPIGSNTVRLRVPNKGHEFLDRAGEMYVVLTPTTENKDESMIIVDRNVVSTIMVGFDKLLFGGEVEVEVVGDKKQTIQIQPMSKIGSEITLDGYGARKQGNFVAGNHIVVLDIKYPEKSKLNDSLRKELEKTYM